VTGADERKGKSEGTDGAFCSFDFAVAPAPLYANTFCWPRDIYSDCEEVGGGRYLKSELECNIAKVTLICFIVSITLIDRPG